MAIAKIIVDVPLMQTDQPYSYRIPEEFEEMLEVGMRVHVPFGKGNRLIQGIRKRNNSPRSRRKT